MQTPSSSAPCRALLLTVLLAAAAPLAAIPTGLSVALDGAGVDVALRVVSTPTAVFVVGVTSSPDFPVTFGPVYAGDSSAVGARGDMFVGRFDPATGATVWLRYLGGAGADVATGLALDGAGTTLGVAGWTTSTDFPVTASAQQSASGGASDAVFAQFDLDGNLLYATYLGGSGEDQLADLCFVPAFTGDGHWAAGGFSTSLNFPFPAVNGASAVTSKTQTDADGLIVAFRHDAARTYTLAGFHRRSAGFEDIILGLCPAALDGFWVTGTTRDPNFWNSGSRPSGMANKNVFVNGFDLAGGRTYSKHIGGEGDDTPWDLVLVPDVNVVVVGETTSRAYPTSTALFQPAYGGGAKDGFVHLLFSDFPQSNGFATYFGGEDDDAVRAVVPDASPSFHLAGTTSSTTLPQPDAASVLATAIGQPTYGGGASDGFVATLRIFSSDPRVRYDRFTYDGGPGEDGFTAVAPNYGAAPASDSGPYFPLAAGTYNNPPAAPAAAPQPSPRAKPAAPTNTTANEAVAVTLFGSGETGPQADLAGAFETAIEFTSQLPAGEEVEIDLVITNNGPSPTNTAVYTISFPIAAGTLVRAVASDGHTPASVVTGDLREISGPATLVAGGTLRVTMTIIPSEGFLMVDGQLFGFGVPDPVLANNNPSRQWTVVNPRIPVLKAFKDDNRNGRRDAGETASAALTGATLTDPATGASLGEAMPVEGAPGEWTFDPLSEVIAAVDLTADLAEGFGLTTGLGHYQVTEGEVLECEVGVTPLNPDEFGVGALIFSDINGNGRRDAGEPLELSGGRRLFVDHNGNRQLDAGEPFAESDVRGAVYLDNGLVVSLPGAVVLETEEDEVQTSPLVSTFLTSFDDVPVYFTPRFAGFHSFDDAKLLETLFPGPSNFRHEGENFTYTVPLTPYPEGGFERYDFSSGDWTPLDVLLEVEQGRLRVRVDLGSEPPPQLVIRPRL